MKLTGFKAWLHRRGADASKRSLGFVEPARIRAVIPSERKQQDYGTMAAWNQALSRMSLEKIRTQMRRP